MVIRYFGYTMEQSSGNHTFQIQLFLKRGMQQLYKDENIQRNHYN